MVPIYFLQIFTCKGGFRTNPLLGSRILNLCGLHLIRLLLTHFIYKLRYLYVFRLLDKQEKEFYNQHGYLCITNIFSEASLNNLVEDINYYDGHGYFFTEGSTKTWIAPFSKKNITKYQWMVDLINNKDINKRIKFSIRKHISPLFYIQQIQQYFDSSTAQDPQYTLHSDTFFPTIKCWLYLEDVTAENGPFQYCPGSHKLTWRRIVWEYKEVSIIRNDMRI